MHQHISVSSHTSACDDTCALCVFQGYITCSKIFFFFFFICRLALPQWVRMINDTQMDSGEKLQWECKAIGRPRPTYRWLRNGLPLTSQVPTLLHNTHLDFFDCPLQHLNYSYVLHLCNMPCVEHLDPHMMLLYIFSGYRVELKS